MRAFVFLTALLLVWLPLAALAAERERLVVETAAGLEFPFSVEIADTPELRARGLMFRTRMAVDEGMLFLFDREEIQSFWMKNTRLSLDIIYISSAGRDHRSARPATPGSLRSVVSKAPAQFVLELIGGTAARLGIRPGRPDSSSRGRWCGEEIEVGEGAAAVRVDGMAVLDETI